MRVILTHNLLSHALLSLFLIKMNKVEVRRAGCNIQPHGPYSDMVCGHSSNFVGRPPIVYAGCMGILIAPIKNGTFGEF